MKRLIAVIRAVNDGDQGHATVGLLALVGGIGAVVLGIGATGNSDAVTIAGGVILGIGVLGGSIASHMGIDYDIYARLEKLEKK